MSLYSRPPRWLPVGWLYAVALVHLFGSVVVTWATPYGLFDGYLGSLELAFWGQSAPAPARAQQAWWLALFGATLQSYALYMLALVHLGHRLKMPMIWGWLIAGIVLWAPQDILISLQAGVWSHVWVDAAVLLALLPPLFWLYRHDRKVLSGQTQLEGVQ